MLGGPALVLLICAGFYWKLTLTTDYTWLDSPDIANMDAPRLQFMAAELHRGRFPLWDPHQWLGQPFLGQFTGIAYPVNWLLALAPLPKNGKLAPEVFNWYFVLTRFMGGLFCYLLCRDLARSRTAAIAAASIFMFGGMIGSTDWPEVINGAIWMPLIFLFLLRALRGERVWASAALSGVFLGISWLAGHHEIPIYASFTVAGVWIYAAIDSRREAPQMVKLAATAMLAAVLVSAFQTLPGYEFGRLAVRWAGVDSPLVWKQAVPYVVHAEYSSTPAAWLGVIFAGLNRHVSPYIGITAFALAISGAVLGWKRREVRILAIAGLAALIFSIGAYNQLHGLLYAALPLFGVARIPARMLAVFGFSAAVLAAFGLDLVREGLAGRWVRRMPIVLAALGGAVFAIIFALAMGGRFDAGQSYAITAVAALLLAATIEGWRRGALKPAAVLLVIPLLILVELGNGGLIFASRYDKSRGEWVKRLHQNEDIVRFLHQQPGPVRVHYDDREISINLGDWENLDTQGGFTAAVTRNLYLEEGHTKRTRDLFAINFTIARQPTQPNQDIVWQAENGLKVMRNKDAFPRVWPAHKVTAFASREELIPQIQDRAINLRDTVLMTGKPPVIETCDPAADRVTYNGASVNGVSISATLGCRGIVVLADTYFPGWHATVDGRRTPVFEVYGALRGIVVDGGAHRIEYRYRPATAIAGGVMSLTGVLGALVLVALSRRRRDSRIL